MSIVWTRPQADVIHVHAESQFELTSTFVRLQEFYESPYDAIRGAYGWDLNKLAAEYVKDGKPFDYFSKWNGMNVPGHVVWDFFGNFEDLSEPELKLNALLYRALRKGVNPHSFYLIGTWKEEDITHELAHAMYYLDHGYKAQMWSLVCDLKLNHYRQVYLPLRDWLMAKGYSDNVVDDEMQAYLATSPLTYLQDKMGLFDGREAYMAGLPFRETFKRRTGKEPI